MYVWQMICSRPNLYAGRGGNTLYFPVGYKSLLSEVCKFKILVPSIQILLQFRTLLIHSSSQVDSWVHKYAKSVWEFFSHDGWHDLDHPPVATWLPVHFFQVWFAQEFLFIGDRPRKLKTFKATAWPPPIARRPRTDARSIANAVLSSVV